MDAKTGFPHCVEGVSISIKLERRAPHGNTRFKSAPPNSKCGFGAWISITNAFKSRVLGKPDIPKVISYWEAVRHWLHQNQKCIGGRKIPKTGL
jgi:hypothetical protein